MNISSNDKKPNILFLGFTIPDDLAESLFTLDSMPAVQTHKFSWSMARTLTHISNRLILASACPIQNYPLGRKIFFKGKHFEGSTIKGITLGFVNLIILKHITRFLACILNLPRLIAIHRIDWVFIHGIHSPFLLFGLLSRPFGIKIAVILTDPPGVTLPSDSIPAQKLKLLDAWFIRKILKHADAVIALAPELLTHFKIERPSLVFPGILDSTLTEYISKNHQSSPPNEVFTVVYAGGLNRAYGVDLLIEAILEIDEFPILLKTFGRGDQEEKLKKLSAADPRFQYEGFVSHDELIPELMKADLLVNPRPSKEDFSIMSFPSKLIEYLATGRPVLTTRIASIPETYKPLFYYIEDETAKGIKRAITNITKESNSQRDLLSLKSQNFIKNEASELAIGKRITSLIKNATLNNQERR